MGAVLYSVAAQADDPVPAPPSSADAVRVAPCRTSHAVSVIGEVGALGGVPVFYGGLMLTYASAIDGDVGFLVAGIPVAVVGAAGLVAGPPMVLAGAGREVTCLALAQGAEPVDRSMLWAGWGFYAGTLVAGQLGGPFVFGGDPAVSITVGVLGVGAYYTSVALGAVVRGQARHGSGGQVRVGLVPDRRGFRVAGTF